MLANEWLMECGFTCRTSTLANRKLYVSKLLWFLDKQKHTVCDVSALRAFFHYLTHSYLGQLIGQTVTSETGSVLSAFSYGYDGRGRLTAETQAASAGNGLTAGYTYDLSNNVRPTVQAGWSFNASNQLTNTAASGAGLSGGTGIGYDASGNVSAVDGQTLSWDGWGRLTGVGSGITYAYDSAGRRMDFPRKSVQSVKQVGSCGILF